MPPRPEPESILPVGAGALPALTRRSVLAALALAGLATLARAAGERLPPTRPAPETPEAPKPRRSPGPSGNPRKPAARRSREESSSLVPLREIARRLRFTHRLLPSGSEVELRGADRVLLFEADNRDFRLDRIKVFLADPARRIDADLALSRLDLERLILPLLQPAALNLTPPRVPRKICIDPGHGGQDPGTQSRRLGMKEKDFVLSISSVTAEQLRRAGFEVHLTRTEDRFIPLADRPAFARRNHCDLFLSVHLNANESESISGTETFILTPATQHSTGAPATPPSERDAVPGNEMDPWNALLGWQVHRSMIHRLKLADRGLRRARFAVLRELHCPGVLCESAYLSHPREAALIRTEAFRREVAASLGEAVIRYRDAVVALGAR